MTVPSHPSLSLDGGKEDGFKTSLVSLSILSLFLFLACFDYCATTRPLRNKVLQFRALALLLLLHN